MMIRCSPRRLAAFSALLILAPGLAAQTVPADGAMVDPETEARIEALIDDMTIDEKVGQLNQYSGTFDFTGPAPSAGDAQLRFQRIRDGLVGAMLNVTGAEATRRAQQLAVENSRLGIPMLFGLDVIHGYRTIFPIPLAEAASWDLEAIELSARVAAREAAAAGIHWTFAPMVDIGRDARWGRVMEGAGEDPYLGSRIAAARVRGFQGDDLADLETIAATAKHFAGYGFAEAGREYNTVDVGTSTLWNVVFPPFQAALEAGVATVMNGFNVLDGVPVTGSAYLQRELLKGEWGFPGFVVSDWQSIQEMVVHGAASDAREAALQAITAGSDMDMEAEAYLGHLDDLVESGSVDEALLDDAVRRILRVKFALGLFDDPYRYSSRAREDSVLFSPEHRSAAREVARRSIVLLKNDGALLPLAKDVASIAVIGSLAADKDAPLGSWRATGGADAAVSLLEGIEAAVAAGASVTFAEGYRLGVGERSFVGDLALELDDRSGFEEAIRAAESADVVVLALGEEAFQSGEARSVTDLRLKGQQQALFDAVYEVNPNVVVVLMNGRPLAIPEIDEAAPAIVEAWHLGSEAGHAIADVLFGDVNPSGKLPMSFPRVTGQVPIYYNAFNTGRPSDPGTVFWSHYTDAPNEPLYPFGFGLSYSRFEYGDLELARAAIPTTGEVTIRVTVTNSGERDGTEVVQLYVRDRVGSRVRPVRELKGFQRIHLLAGESRTVVFTLRAEDLAFYTARNRWEVEPGEFDLFVGGDSTADLAAVLTVW